MRPEMPPFPRRARIHTPELLLCVALLNSACASHRAPDRESTLTRAGSAPSLVTPVFRFDSTAERVIAKGLVHRSYVDHSAPLSVQVLEVDLKSCWAVRTVKAGPGAVGRATTSSLANSLGNDVAAAVNADFFLFAPPGVPVGLTTTEGRAISGPNRDRPVFMVGRDGKPWMGYAATHATLEFPDHTQWNTINWNALSRDTLRRQVTLVDGVWGDTTPSLVDPRAFAISSRSLPVSRMQQANAIKLGRRYDVQLQQLSDALSFSLINSPLLWIAHGPIKSAIAPTLPASSATLQLNLFRSRVPFAGAKDSVRDKGWPREAVGAQPMLIRDSVIVGDVDTNGNAGFRGVNPRTAIGIAARGRRLYLIVVDGRQAGFSRGTSLRETADILLALGAHDAVNLDGGGSSAMVVRDPVTHALSVVNKPSDAAGERPVADALAIVPTCASRPPTR